MIRLLFKRIVQARDLDGKFHSFAYYIDLLDILADMNTTLDEREILHTVVELGGFAPAAEQFNRSQSTVSYAVARLQEKLGIRLFELKGRKAQLTEAGRLLLAYAEPHVADFHQTPAACLFSRRGRSDGDTRLRRQRFFLISVFLAL